MVCDWIAGGQEPTTRMRVYLKVLRRDLEPKTLPRLISLKDAYNWARMRDINTDPGFCSHVNWHLNAQLSYPTVLEGKPGKLRLAYSWA